MVERGGGYFRNRTAFFPHGAGEALKSGEKQNRYWWNTVAPPVTAFLPEINCFGRLCSVGKRRQELTGGSVQVVEGFEIVMGEKGFLA